MNFVLPILLPDCLAAGVDVVLPEEATPQMFVAIFLAQHLGTPSAMLAFFRKLGVPLQGMCDGMAQDGDWPHTQLSAENCVDAFNAVATRRDLGTDLVASTQCIFEAASATPWPHAAGDVAAFGRAVHAWASAATTMALEDPQPLADTPGYARPLAAQSTMPPMSRSAMCSENAHRAMVVLATRASRAWFVDTNMFNFSQILPHADSAHIPAKGNKHRTMADVEAATGVEISLLGFWCGSAKSVSPQCLQRLLDVSDAEFVDIIDKYLSARRKDIADGAYGINGAPTFGSLANQLADAASST